MDIPTKKIISSYALSSSAQSSVIQPKNIQEIENCLKYAKKNKLKIAIMGSGNSWTDVFLATDQLIVDLSHFDQINSFDKENGIVNVQSGVKIGNLLAKLMPENFTLIGLSGSVTDTIGGMLSSNVHGKDTWKEGNFGQNIISFTMLLADNSIISVDLEKNNELFNAVIGGLGFMGIVLDISLKLKRIKSYMLELQTHQCHNLDELFEYFYSLEKNNLDFSYGLIDPFQTGNSLGRAICESASYQEIENCSKKDFEEFLTPKSKIAMLEPETFWKLFRFFWGYKTSKVLNSFQYNRAKGSKRKFIPFPKFQYPISAFPKFNLMYAPSGFMEFHTVFPKNEVKTAFIELLEKSTHYKRQPWVCGVKRHKKDPSYLSFSEDGLAITINFPLNNFPKYEREKYCDELISIITKHTGKIYISKHAYLPKKIFEEMYPDYTKILDLKNKYDPEIIFSSIATERLLLKK